MWRSTLKYKTAQQMSGLAAVCKYLDIYVDSLEGDYQATLP